VLDTDSLTFGGFGANDDSVRHFTQYDSLYAAHDKGWLKLYLPARVAIVLRKVDEKTNKQV
jgi:1,4-alpha-glucan branching enzyme